LTDWTFYGFRQADADGRSGGVHVAKQHLGFGALRSAK
jgi:hypothetical protein